MPINVEVNSVQLWNVGVCKIIYTTVDIGKQESIREIVSPFGWYYLELQTSTRNKNM